jgi:peptidoglycan/LPS O-acetylase OafA/YrhL
MSTNRLDVLDGWRGISILLVLAGHLFPIGPKSWELNGAVAGAGMAIFFTLSGFLITSVLLRDANVRRFLIHRIMRIMPLAWLAIVLALSVTRADGWRYLPHLLFYANELNDPSPLTGSTGHFWSLCVEVQFYAFVALLVAALGRRGLFVLPLVAVGVTIVRVVFDKPMAINTEFRVDEILAGCILALSWNRFGARFEARGLGLATLVAAPLLLLAAHPAGGALDYFRPYLASAMVGSTLGLGATHPMRRLLSSRLLRYVAKISYALYVIHGCLGETWLASGDKMVKYAKRPLFLLVTFGLADLSTRYYEKYFIDLGRRWAGSTRIAATPEKA